MTALWHSAVTVAMGIAITAAATASTDTAMPVVPDALPINGWYHCNPSTLWNRGDDTPGPGYYLETKGRKGEHGGKLHAPRVKLDASRRWNMPFLDSSLERSVEKSAWRGPRGRKAHKGKQGGGGASGPSGAPKYECAEFRVPFCYENVCTSNRTIDIFVKRVVASTALDASEPKKSLWVLQGGPGASSTAMEDLLDTMYEELDGKVTVYTMDHRGTARSNRLECQAAESQMPGSPGGSAIVIDEVPDCINDMLFKLDNQTAAYSVTSAAMDLRTIIDHTLADEDVYVYGLSYGTYLVERLMHFAPQSVKGFAIDGIVSEAGATVEERSTYSNWDHDVGVVADRFLGYCMADPFCKSQFPADVDNLTTYILNVYKQLDNARPGENGCADVLQRTGRRPSYFLRSLLGEYIMSQEWRMVIPAILLRVSRCSPRDVEALDYLINGVTSGGGDDQTVDLDDVLFTSELLYYLIVFSEMWEYPTPSKDTMIQWYENATMASDNYNTLPYYCLFTGSREDACRALKHLPPSRPMRYERDQFWNSTAKLPDHASALLLSGGLDVQTRRMYGNLEYELLEGNRMLVYFDYAGHCTTFTTPTKSSTTTCGAQILASYVREDGDVHKVDTSCMNDIYPLDFTSNTFLAGSAFGTTDLYN